MALATPTGSNVFIPAHDATGGMVVGYSRNINDFAINRYSAVKPVNRTAGKYLFLDPSVNARVVDEDSKDAVWEDGADSPSGAKNAVLFEFENYRTTRYRESCTTGDKALAQADWGLEDANGAMLGQLQMTRRTLKALKLLRTGSWGNNTADATAILNVNGVTGQHMGNGSATSPNIKKVIQYVGMSVHKSTFGVVKPDDLVMVCNPSAAYLMSQSPEIQNALIQSPYAFNQLTGDGNVNEKWGLPRRLYGMPLEVEDCVRNNAARNAAANPTYCLDTPTIYFLAYPGGKQVVKADENPDEPNVPVKHTLIGFYYEEMSVEGWVEQQHRRTTAYVTSDYDFQLSSVLTGFKLTNSFTA